MSPDRWLMLRLREARVVPVLVVEDAAAADPLARALIEGGLPVAEVTFRTAAAAEVIRRMAEEHPGLLVGAGTVLTPEQVDQAEAAGARFIVAPGFNPAVVDRCLSRGLPVIPGIATPSEIEAAMSRGLRTLKFFPAEPLGGLGYLKAIAAPYRGLDFVPTGGIGPANLGEYLAFPRVAACGGSWMAPAEWVTTRQFDRIREATRGAVAIAQAGKDRAE